MHPKFVGFKIILNQFTTSLCGSAKIIRRQKTPPKKLKIIIDNRRPIFMKRTPASNSAGTSDKPEIPKFRNGSPPKLVALMVRA